MNNMTTMKLVTVKIAITLLLTVFINSYTYSAPAPDIGSGFNYQGELIDGGAPVNVNFDIRILAFEAPNGGSDLGDEEFLNVTVENGLFTIPEVDFGPGLYQGKEVWLEIRVRKSGTGTYHTLSPRQRLSAVPYAVQAEFLASNGASNNDVLQFDGSNWVPQALTGVGKWQTHYTDPNSINYTAGRVGIGTVYSSSRLHVQAPTGETPLSVHSGFSVTSLKLKVNTNGGLSVGTATMAPADGLLVKGNTKIEGTTTLQGDATLQGNVKQPLSSNGMMKYMVHAVCGSSSSLIKSYNGVGSDSVTVSGSAPYPGNCFIQFPFNINNRFWQVTEIGFGADKKASTCRLYLNNYLQCLVFKASNGNEMDGEIMVLVY